MRERARVIAQSAFQGNGNSTPVEIDTKGGLGTAAKIQGTRAAHEAALAKQAATAGDSESAKAHSDAAKADQASAGTLNGLGKDGGATPVDDSKTWLGGLAYDLGVVKLFGQYGKVDNTTRHVDYKIYELGGAVPVGPGKILAQYGQISPSVGARRKTFTVGYDHWLSKRTDVYAEVDYTRLQGAWVALNSAAAFNNSGNTYGNNSRLGVMLGVRHKF